MPKSQHHRTNPLLATKTHDRRHAGTPHRQQLNRRNGCKGCQANWREGWLRHGHGIISIPPPPPSPRTCGLGAAAAGQPLWAAVGRRLFRRSSSCCCRRGIPSRCGLWLRGGGLGGGLPRLLGLAQLLADALALRLLHLLRGLLNIDARQAGGWRVWKGKIKI